jgi:hypothetical protein
VFDTPVFSFSGQVDAVLEMLVSCATASGQSFLGRGFDSFDVSASGNFFSIQSEYGHGTQYKDISIAPVQTEVCVGPLQTYVSSGSGRDTGWSTYIQPYANGGSILFGAYVQDGYYSQAAYSVTWNLQQQVPFTVLW